MAPSPQTPPPDPAAPQAGEGLGITADEASGHRLVDVRRPGAFDASDVRIDGAMWRDPAKIDEWVAELPKDRPVVVYCVHGHEVSQGAASRLRAVGLDARYLIGGIEGWRAEGRPVASKPRR